MKIFAWWLQGVVSLVGLVATYLPLYADIREIPLWKMAWQYWTGLGVTILWVSLASVIFRLYRMNKSFQSKEYTLKLEKLEREVKQLRADQYTMDTGHLI